MNSFEKIDTHSHLDMSQFDEDRSEVILNSLQEGTICINMGTDSGSNREVVELAQSYSNLYAGVGFHPHQASSFEREVLEEIRDLASRPPTVAVGEIGLDYYRDNSPREDQREAFEALLDLALQLDLPVSIHNRSSTEDLLEILGKDRFGPLRGVVHSFFGDRELAEKFIRMGLILGISGPLTYHDNEELRSTIKNVSLEKIVVETDAPYLTPAPHRGKRNEPNYVKHVIEKIAELKNFSVGKVAEKTENNARRCFGLGEGR